MKFRGARARTALAAIAATVLAGAGSIFVTQVPASAGAECGSAPTWTPLASTPDGASCSLRDVLDNLAGNGDMVVLEPGATYPVDFDECSSIDIHSSVTIMGNGATVLIDCLDTDSRAFDVEAPDVVIDNLIVTTSPGMGGGGAINVEADGLLVRNSTISDNLNCTQPGGGFSSINNSFEIVSSTITRNLAILGGGIAGGLDGISNVSLTNSTVSGNGALAGGGIWIREGFLDLVYTDVVSNRGAIPEPEACQLLEEKGSGEVWTQGAGPGLPANILLLSVPEGPGGVGAQQVDTHLTSFASVIADPLSDGLIEAPVVNCGTFEGPFTNTVSNGYNFSDDATCDLTGTGDRESAGDPVLGALASNGGPTQTRLPGDTSPLIDGVPLAQCQADGATGVATDQRGITRPQGAGCDIGSVEVVPQAEEIVEVTPLLAG
jgi:hypothetical protein